MIYALVLLKVFRCFTLASLSRSALILGPNAVTQWEGVQCARI